MQSVTLAHALTSNQNLWTDLGAQCVDTNTHHFDIPVPRAVSKSLLKKAASGFLNVTPVKPQTRRFIRLLCSGEPKGLRCSATLRNGAPPIALSINQFRQLLSSTKYRDPNPLEEQTSVDFWQHSVFETSPANPLTLPKPFLAAKNLEDLLKLFNGRKDVRWKTITESSCQLPIPWNFAKGQIFVTEKNVADEKGHPLKTARSITVFENGDLPYSFPARIVSRGAIDTTGSDSSDMTEDFLKKAGMLCAEKKHDGLPRHVCAVNEKALNRVWPAKWKVFYWKKRYKIPTLSLGGCFMASVILQLWLASRNGPRH